MVAPRALWGHQLFFPDPLALKLLSSPPSYVAFPLETKMVIFLEPVFPQISGDTRAAVSMETFPANLGKEELGSPPAPSPHHPLTAPAPACRGAPR